MAKQNINVGTAANDKKGDSLRAAFQKVNANFTELYTELGLVNDVTLSLGAFEFAGSTISTTDSTAIVIDQATTVTSNLSVGGDILPQTANGGDLGSSTLPWRSLYVSNNTIYIGGVPLGIDANGNLTVNSSPVTGGGVSSLVNGAYTVSLGSTGVLTLANAARLQDSASGSISLGIGASGWATAQGAGAIAIGQNAGGEFQSDNTVAVGYYAGSARQGASAVAVGRQAGQLDQGIQAVSIGLQAGYSLQGMFGVAVGPSAGETSQGAGAVAVGQSAGATSQGAGAVAVGQSAGQNYQAANTIILNASGSAVNGVSGQTDSFYVAPIRNAISSSGLLQYNATTKEITYSSDIRSEGNINIDINLSDSTLRRWQFGEDGNLAVPGDINLSGGTITQYSQNGLTGLKLVANADQGQNVTIMGTGNNTFPILNYVGTTLSGITIGTPEGDWNFMNGDLTIPGDIRSEGNINIEINLSDSTLRRWQFGEDGSLTLPSVGKISNGAYDWTFGTDGALTIPGDIKSTANTSIIIDGGVLLANVTVDSVDSFGAGVWRMFITSSAYPTLGTIVQVGDTATTAWGTPVTVTITSIVQDVGAGTWALHTNQNITTGWYSGGARRITINSTRVKTWTFSTDKSLTFPDGTVQTTAWTGTFSTLSVTGAVTAETFNTDQITVVGNRISTTVTNANLELECNGSGGVVINAVADATTASTVKSVGYLGLPQSATTTSGTLAISDAGKHIYVTTTGQAIAIPDNSLVAYPIGTTLTFIAGPSATTVLIVINTDTLRLAGSSSTGTRTLAANGMATAVKVASTLWYINGTGLT